MLYLHNGQYKRARELEEYISNDPELKSHRRFAIGDFRLSDLEYNCRHFRIKVDIRVRELSEYLLSNTESADEWLTANFPGLQTRTTFFFMDGSGPSPFNATLNDVYLKVGHYRKRPNDREIVIHAIVHEITHLYLRNTLGFRVCTEEFGIRKFFDEGFAQLCGFRAAGVLDRKRAHADTCAKAAIAKGLRSLQDKIKDWETTIFQIGYFPLYQSALSFAAYSEEQFGYETLVKVFRNSSCDMRFHDVIIENTRIAFNSLLEKWAEYLSDYNSTEEADFFKILNTERTDPKLLQVEYQSKFPLYPRKDILVYNSCAEQMSVSSNSKFRYQETGTFCVECPSDTLLDFIIAFDNKVQNISIEKSK